MFVRIAGAGEPTDYTFSGPSLTGAVGSILAYSGVNVVQPVHASAGAITRNSKGLTASISTSVPQTHLVGAFTHSGRTSIASPPGMAARTDALTGTGAPNARMLTADQLLSSAGSHSRTAQAQAKNTCNVAQLVALNAAPDPPTNTTPPVISGPALENQVLTASAGSWSGSPTGYAYRWERCDSGGGGCSVVPEATGTSYQLTIADVGSTLRVVVTASNAGGSTSAASGATAVVAPIAPPVNVDPPAISGDPREGQTLTATSGTWSGSPVSFDYEWERCDDAGSSCAPISAANSATHELTSLDSGFTIRVVVRASNSAGSTTASSAATAVVLPVPPVNSAPPVVSGATRLGEILVVSPGSWSGAPTSYGFQWERCDAEGAACSAVGGATAETYPLGGDDMGRRVRVVVTASNAGGSGSAASAPTAIVLPEPPANLVPPAVSGTPRESEPLSAGPGSWSGSPTTFAYQWQRSTDGGLTWNDVSGTSADYVSAAADVGSWIRVVVTASNAGGSEAAASVPTGPIAPAVAPANVVPPTISGAPQEGSLLTSTTGAWTGSPTGYEYLWERCEQDGVACAPIVDAAGAEYTPEAIDIGSRLRVVVSATNPGGTGTATSEASAAVLRAAPTNSSPPMVSGTSLEGEDLSATTGDWSGDPTAFAYLWHRCAVDGEDCAPVTWADSSTYRLREADVGLTIRVLVTAMNDGGPASKLSEASAVVIPLPPVNETTPIVSGVLEEGEPLSATDGTWQSSGPLSYTYQWQVSIDGGSTWTDRSGADETMYELTGADVATVLRVVVTAANAGGSASAASEPTDVVSSPGRPVNTEPPTYSGFVQAGRTVVADAGEWSGTPTVFAYQWQRSDDEGQTWSDAGATGSSYSLSVVDVGLHLRVLVTATNTFGSGLASSPSTSMHAAESLVAVANQPWRCNTATDLTFVKVTMWTRDADAVVLANGCTGRVGRVEVDTWTADALKTVNSSTNAAHDLVIESGYAECHDRTPGLHQDGWQSMGGARITIRNFVWACGSMDDPFGGGVAQSVVIQRAGANVTIPTDTVVEHSVLMSGAAVTFAVGESLRSGIRNSVACPDRTGSTPLSNLGGAVDLVYETVDEAPESDPRCSSLAAALAWAEAP